MIETMPKEQSENELFSEFENEKKEIREIADKMNEKAWDVSGDDVAKVDASIKMRNEFIAGKVKESGVEKPPEDFAAYHYFIGSGLSAGSGYEFDTEEGLVLKSIREISKYL